MKKLGTIFFVFLCVLILTNCSNQSIKKPQVNASIDSEKNQLEDAYNIKRVTVDLQVRDGISYLPDKVRLEPFTGVYEKYYPNGQKNVEYYYKNGKLNGLMTGWNQYGEKTLQIEYKNGKQDGIVIEYKDGKKHIFREYENDKQIRCIVYFEGSEQKALESEESSRATTYARFYRNGKNKYFKSKGNETYWSENGEIELEIKDDIAYLPNTYSPFTGKHTHYDADGRKEIEKEYKNGKIDGLSTLYVYDEKSGQVFLSKSEYKNGVFLRDINN